MRVTKYIFLLLSFVFLLYLSLPSLTFPPPPPGAFTSLEQADTESEYRRAYFTNLTRQEVLEYYQNEFKISFFGIEIPNYRLNYPPEDAYSLIRDQTRSTFLEEIVYPFKGSFFVNGFKPSVAKDDIWYKGVNYYQKITVRIASGNRVLGLAIGGLTLVISWRMIVLYREVTVDVKTRKRKPK